MTGPTPTTLRLRRRLAGIKLLRDGKLSHSEVARLLGVSREAVRRWAVAYAEGGAAALAPSPGKRGPRPALTEAQLRAAVAEAWGGGDGRTLAELLATAQRRHPSASLSRSALRRRLIDLGLWP